MASYKELLAEIETLTRKAEAMREEQKPRIVAEMLAQITEYGIDFEDLRPALAPNLPARSAKSLAKATASGAPRAPIRPKYRDPVTGSTWTGRGKMPRWLVSALGTGKQREDFLIQSA